MNREDRPPDDYDELLQRVEELRRRLAPGLSSIDPGDLHAILVALLRPWGSGRTFFLRQIRPNVYVF